MTREELEAERDMLDRKLKARERAGTGYGSNIIAIRARIAEIDAELESLDG